MFASLIWSAARIALFVGLVVGPLGYAVTGLHADVAMGVGCGIAMGLGVGLRGGNGSGRWAGVLIGSIIGVATALIAGLVPGERFGLLLPPILGLAVGLIAGLRGASVSGYWDVAREASIVAVLLVLGLVPTWIAQDRFASGLLSLGTLLVGATLLLSGWTALIAGLLSHRREGWRDARPPLLLALPAVLVPVALAVGTATGLLEEGRGLRGLYLVSAIVAVVAISAVLPAGAFLLGRTAIDWLQPRLRVYGHIAEYLRVMWVPIGAFAVGYLTIIVLFAGFYGMLERFQPGAFAQAGDGIAAWLSFAFFTALGQEFATATPVSASARLLVGTHLILSAGWAVVLFAAVMSSIGPKLDQIARRHGERDQAVAEAEDHGDGRRT